MANTPTTPPTPNKVPAPPILDLDRVVERPTVKIDGRLYRLKTREDLSFLDNAELAAAGRELAALGVIDPLTVETAQRMHDLLDAVCRQVIVGAGDDVHQALSDTDRLQVAASFILLLRGMSPAEPAGATTADPATTSPTPERSSPSSSGSTAATHGAG